MDTQKPNRLSIPPYNLIDTDLISMINIQRYF